MKYIEISCESGPWSWGLCKTMEEGCRYRLPARLQRLLVGGHMFRAEWAPIASATTTWKPFIQRGLEDLLAVIPGALHAWPRSPSIACSPSAGGTRGIYDATSYILNTVVGNVGDPWYNHTGLASGPGSLGWSMATIHRHGGLGSVQRDRKDSKRLWIPWVILSVFASWSPLGVSLVWKPSIEPFKQFEPSLESHSRAVQCEVFSCHRGWLLFKRWNAFEKLVRRQIQ